MRLFIALNLPPELQARIAAEVPAPLRARVPGVRWVREETLHDTLAFIGERSEADTREAYAGVREVAATQRPFHVLLTGLGIFPGPARPRVVWLGLADPTPLHEVYRVLERKRSRLSIPVEGRAYHPHVTLGRVPPHAGCEVRNTLAPALGAVKSEFPVTLKSLDLMSSALTPQGARYTVLLAAPFTTPNYT